MKKNIPYYCKKPVIILLALGGFVRIFFSFIPGFKIDMDAWFAWAERLNSVGPAGFYSDTVWTNYTPGYLYVLWFLGILRDFWQIPDSSFYLILKLPSIIAEIAMAALVYRLLSTKSKRWAVIATCFVLFNPAFIFNSSVWGQIDGLVSLILLLSIYFLSNNLITLASLFFGLSFLIKPQAIALLPLLGLSLFKKPSLSKIIKFVLIPPFVILVFSYPFFTTQPLFGLPHLFMKMVSDYSFTSLFAYNFWGVIGSWIPDSHLWHGIPFQKISYILLTIYWLVILYYHIKSKLSVYSLALLATLSFYFLPTRVHERYLYPALIFLIIVTSSFRSKFLLLLTMLLGFVHFLNLYYVYVYYNEVSSKSPRVLYSEFLYNFLDTNAEMFSILSVIIFIIISIVTIKLNYDHKKSL